MSAWASVFWWVSSNWMPAHGMIVCSPGMLRLSSALRTRWLVQRAGVVDGLGHGHHRGERGGRGLGHRAVEAALVERGHRLGGRVALGRLDRPGRRPHQPVHRRGGRVERLRGDVAERERHRRLGLLLLVGDRLQQRLHARRRGVEQKRVSGCTRGPGRGRRSVRAVGVEAESAVGRACRPPRPARRSWYHVLAGLVLRVQHGDLAGLDPAAPAAARRTPRRPPPGRPDPEEPVPAGVGEERGRAVRVDERHLEPLGALAGALGDLGVVRADSAFTPWSETSSVTASPAAFWIAPLRASAAPSWGPRGVTSLTTRLTLAPPRLGRPASEASGSGIDGLSPLITSTASLAPFCASMPAAWLGPLSWRQQPDLQRLVAAGRGRGGVVTPAGAGGGERERGDDEQSEAGSPGDHRAGGPQRRGRGGLAAPAPCGRARPAQATPSRVTPIHRQRTVTDRQRSADATNGVHGAVAGGPIVPEKYPETASARGKVARAGGKTTRGAPGRLEPARAGQRRAGGSPRRRRHDDAAATSGAVA